MLSPPVQWLCTYSILLHSLLHVFCDGVAHAHIHTEFLSNRWQRILQLVVKQKRLTLSGRNIALAFWRSAGQEVGEVRRPVPFLVTLTSWQLKVHGPLLHVAARPGMILRVVACLLT